MVASPGLACRQTRYCISKACRLSAPGTRYSPPVRLETQSGEDSKEYDGSTVEFDLLAPDTLSKRIQIVQYRLLEPDDTFIRSWDFSAFRTATCAPITWASWSASVDSCLATTLVWSVSWAVSLI